MEWINKYLKNVVTLIKVYHANPYSRIKGPKKYLFEKKNTSN